MENLKRSIYAIRAGSKFEKSLLKATYDGDFDPPKEKHIQNVISGLQGLSGKVSADQAFNLLVQRLATSKWSSALKSLLIIHRGLETAGVNYAIKVHQANILLESFNDPSEKGSAHNKIIQDYCLYIKKRSNALSKKDSLSLVHETEKSRTVGNLSKDDIIKEFTENIVQLEALVKMGPNFYQALRNYNLKLTQCVLFYVLKDSCTLYSDAKLITSRGFEIFNTLDAELAEVFLTLYQKLESCSKILEQFFRVAENSPYSSLNQPVFIERSKEKIAMMESYIETAKKTASRPKENIDLYPDLSNPQGVGPGIKKTQETPGLFVFSPSPPQNLERNRSPSGMTKVDLIMEAFNKPAEDKDKKNPGIPSPRMMNPMVNPMMNPGMMNPMMNTMMMNPYAGMMNPYASMNPMMMGMGTAPQVKANLDPLSQPTSNSVFNNSKDPYSLKTSQHSGGYSVPGGNNIENLFEAKPNARNLNPFDDPEAKTPSNPFRN